MTNLKKKILRIIHTFKKNTFKNFRKRLPVWMFSAMIISGTLHYSPNLFGVLIAYIEFILAILVDEKLKEGYWFNLHDAAPQTHEAAIAEILIAMLFVIGALLHNPLILIFFVCLAVIATLG